MTVAAIDDIVAVETVAVVASAVTNVGNEVAFG